MLVFKFQSTLLYGFITLYIIEQVLDRDLNSSY